MPVPAEVATVVQREPQEGSDELKRNPLLPRRGGGHVLESDLGEVVDRHVGRILPCPRLRRCRMRNQAWYRITLDCGHAYPVIARPVLGAHLHCPDCDQHRTAVYTTEWTAEEPYNWSEEVSASNREHSAQRQLGLDGGV